jgi:hypothetical protein
VRAEGSEDQSCAQDEHVTQEHLAIRPTCLHTTHTHTHRKRGRGTNACDRWTDGQHSDEKRPEPDKRRAYSWSANGRRVWASVDQVQLPASLQLVQCHVVSRCTRYEAGAAPLQGRCGRDSGRGCTSRTAAEGAGDGGGAERSQGRGEARVGAKGRSSERGASSAEVASGAEWKMKGEGAGGWCRGGCADPPARGGKRSRSQGRQKSRLPHNEHAWLWYDGATAM